MKTGEDFNRHPAYFDAAVLAGERSKDSELLRTFNVPAKALIKVGGKPMIERVVWALLASNCIKRVFLCGENQERFKEIALIKDGMDKGKIIWVENEKGPSMSAYKAIRKSGGIRPILLTTSDHALLRPEHVKTFCSKAASMDIDLAIGLARLETLKIYPGVKRTFYRFRDGKFCTCNLFGFLTPRSFQAPNFWQGLEKKRKNPVKIISGFGWSWAVLYILGLLSLNQALRRASKVIGCRLGAVILEFPEAAIDVDSVEDWRLAEKILKTASNAA